MVNFRRSGYYHYGGFEDYINCLLPLPLPPHRCRLAPHQLPLAAAICIQDLIREAKGKYDENSSNVERVGKQNGKAPRDNQKQNEQVRDIAKKLNLTKDEQRELHDMISGQGYSYQEILELAEEMFGK